jgi:hypothetical protein
MTCSSNGQEYRPPDFARNPESAFHPSEPLQDSSEIIANSISLHRNDSNSRAVTGNMNSDNQIKVPVDFSSHLDSIQKLPVGGVSPEDYLRWRYRLTASIDANIKLQCIATHSPEISWTNFCQENGVKYSAHTLQRLYIGCHMEVWGFIRRSLDTEFSMQLEAEFRQNGENLCSRLGFQMSHPFAYQNAYELLHKVDGIYLQKSFVRTMQLQRDLSHLEYDGDEDPRMFLQKFHEIFNTGKLLGDGWPIYDDRSMAMCLIGKLMGNSLQEVRSNALMKAEKTDFTLKDVEHEIIRWWMQKPLNLDVETTDEAPSSTFSDNEFEEGDNSVDLSEIDDNFPNGSDQDDDNIDNDVDRNPLAGLIDEADIKETSMQTHSETPQSDYVDPEELFRENSLREKEEADSKSKRGKKSTNSRRPTFTLKEKKRLRKKGR